MLPKIWKKFLLAVCIIAILFNITSKLVNRISLEKTILSSPEGINVRELFNMTDETPVTSSKYDNVKESDSTTKNDTEDSMKDSTENVDIYQEDEYEGDTSDVVEEPENDQVTDISDSATLIY